MVLGVHVWDDRETKEDVQKFVKDLNLKHRILLNGRPTAKEAYGIFTVPTVFFIDRDGKVVDVEFQGGADALRAEARELLDKKG